MFRPVLTNKLIKLISSLKTQKYRKIHNLFTVEGHKSISSIISSQKFELYALIVTDNISLEDFDFVKKEQNKLYIATENQMTKISQLSSPGSFLAVFRQHLAKFDHAHTGSGTHFLLDGLQDPGNVGTIIRIADWFGISSVITYGRGVDFFNPKLVQATMGSLGAVSLYQLEGLEAIKQLADRAHLIGLDMTGDDFRNAAFKENPIIIVVGSEGKGISPEIHELIHQFIAISGHSGKTAESLNAAVAAGIMAASLSKN
jgi:RNA methyltransferase, TrmH family